MCHCVVYARSIKQRKTGAATSGVRTACCSAEQSRATKAWRWLRFLARRTRLLCPDTFWMQTMKAGSNRRWRRTKRPGGCATQDSGSDSSDPLQDGGFFDEGADLQVHNGREMTSLWQAQLSVERPQGCRAQQGSRARIWNRARTAV